MKTREEYVKICQRCKKRAMSLQLGVICSLTQQQADYSTPNCSSFLLDEKADRIQRSAEIQDLDDKKNSFNGGIILLILGLLWFLIGIIALDRIFFVSIFMIIGGIIAIAREVTNSNNPTRKIKSKDDTLDDII